MNKYMINTCNSLLQMIRCDIHEIICKDANNDLGFTDNIDSEKELSEYFIKVKLAMPFLDDNYIMEELEYYTTF